MTSPAAESQDFSEATALAQLVRELNARGHNPATSGNYSLRLRSRPGQAFVSESGVDKSAFSEKNFLGVEIEHGRLAPAFEGRKSSDETGLHLAIYMATQAHCVLHSHLLESLLFAELHPGKDLVHVTGLELLKGFRGIKTHTAIVPIPCFENSQNIGELAERVRASLELNPSVYGFLIRGHGLYVWGDNVKEAKRHLEVFEYVFKYHVAKTGAAQ